MYTPQTPDDFRQFLWLVWKHLNLPEPTPMQYDIAYWLEHGPKRCIIEAFRGEGKSWITSAFVVWLLDHHPDWNILVVSASKDRANDFTTFTLRIIHELCPHLAPREDQRNSKVSFDVASAPAAHAPSVKSLGITSQLSGSRANVIVADDIEVPNNSATQMMREKLAEAVKEFDSIVKPGGRVIFLGTPQTEQSVYNKLQQRGYHCRIWPSRFPTVEEEQEYGARLAPYLHNRLREAGNAVRGVPTDPRRFSDLDLREREASYGAAGYAMQFQLRTRLSDAERYPLRVRDLIVLDCDPDKAPEKLIWANSPDLVMNEITNMAMDGDRFHRPMQIVGSWIDYQGSLLSIDPAGRGKDETGYAVTKMLNGQLFIVASGGFLDGYGPETLKALAQIARDHKVAKIEIEANFGDGMFTALLTPVLSTLDNGPNKPKGYAVTIEEVKHSKQKELRLADTLEPVMKSHRLVIDPKVIEADYKSIQGYSQEIAHQYSLIYQMTRLTRDKGALAHDDRLDALALGVAYWVEQMAKDVDEALEDRKQELLDKELEKFMEQVVGHKTPTDIWSPHMR